MVLLFCGSGNSVFCAVDVTGAESVVLDLEQSGKKLKGTRTKQVQTTMRVTGKCVARLKNAT